MSPLKALLQSRFQGLFKVNSTALNALLDPVSVGALQHMVDDIVRHGHAGRAKGFLAWASATESPAAGQLDPSALRELEALAKRPGVAVTTPEAMLGALGRDALQAYDFNLAAVREYFVAALERDALVLLRDPPDGTSTLEMAMRHLGAAAFPSDWKVLEGRALIAVVQRELVIRFLQLPVPDFSRFAVLVPGRASELPGREDPRHLTVDASWDGARVFWDRAAGPPPEGWRQVDALTLNGVRNLTSGYVEKQFSRLLGELRQESHARRLPGRRDPVYLKAYRLLDSGAATELSEGQTRVNRVPGGLLAAVDNSERAAKYLYQHASPTQPLDRTQLESYLVDSRNISRVLAGLPVRDFHPYGERGSRVDEAGGWLFPDEFTRRSEEKGGGLRFVTAPKVTQPELSFTHTKCAVVDQVPQVAAYVARVYAALWDVLGRPTA